MFRLLASDSASLLRMPEDGMGFQFIRAQTATTADRVAERPSASTTPLVVWNAELALDPQDLLREQDRLTRRSTSHVVQLYEQLLARAESPRPLVGIQR